MPAQHNIVLPILSISLSNASTVSKRMDISSQFFDFQLGHHSSFSSPCHYKILKEPLSGGDKYKGWETFANIALYLRNCTR